MEKTFTGLTPLMPCLQGSEEAKEQLAGRDTQLLAAKTECHAAKTDLSTKEAALAAALQTNEKTAKVHEAQHKSRVYTPVAHHKLGQGSVLRHAGQLQTQMGLGNALKMKAFS